tara:strand:+ start:3310 stop:3486 length:177 start_codon:yes stop_codon:yes gene_type:complete
MENGILAIDSSNSHLSVGLFNGRDLLCKETGEFNKSTSEVIFELIESLFLREKKNFLT